MNCRSCGTPLAPGSTYCPTCMRPVPYPGSDARGPAFPAPPTQGPVTGYLQRDGFSQTARPPEYGQENPFSQLLSGNRGSFGSAPLENQWQPPVENQPETPFNTLNRQFGPLTNKQQAWSAASTAETKAQFTGSRLLSAYKMSQSAGMPKVDAGTPPAANNRTQSPVVNPEVAPSFPANQAVADPYAFLTNAPVNPGPQSGSLFGQPASNSAPFLTRDTPSGPFPGQSLRAPAQQGTPFGSRWGEASNAPTRQGKPFGTFSNQAPAQMATNPFDTFSTQAPAQTVTNPFDTFSTQAPGNGVTNPFSGRESTSGPFSGQLPSNQSAPSGPFSGQLSPAFPASSQPLGRAETAPFTASDVAVSKTNSGQLKRAVVTSKKRQSGLSGLRLGIICLIVVLIMGGAVGAIFYLGQNSDAANNSVNLTAQDTTLGTPVAGPSGQKITANAASIILSAQTASQLNNNYIPTTITNSFTTKQTVYLSIIVNSQNQPGYILIKWYANKQLFASDKLTHDPKNTIAFFTSQYSQPGAGMAEVYWCTKADSSDAQLARVVNFTVSA